MKFAVDFQHFMHNRRNITDLLEKIGIFFGDTGASFITVLEISHGSFMLSWTNSTLMGTICQADAIKHIYSQMVRRNGTVRSSFSRHVGHHLQLKWVQLDPLGPCRIIPTRVAETTTVRVATNVRGHGFSIWAHVILPVLIAVLVFIVIILIIIFCNRRRRQQQANVNIEKEAVSNDCNVILYPGEFDAADSPPKTQDPLVLSTDVTPSQNIPTGSSQIKNNLNRDQERARKHRNNREHDWLSKDSQSQDPEQSQDWGKNCHRKHTKDSSSGKRHKEHDRMSRVSASSTLSWDRPNNHYLEEEAGSRSSTLKSTKSTGSDRRHHRSPPPYWQSQTDPPPYRMPPPYLSNNSTQL